MGKYLLIIFMFIVLFSVGYFGQHFGYTSNGTPHGGEITEDWQSKGYFTDQLFFGYWVDFFTDLFGKDSAPAVMVQTAQYLFYFATFQIDGIPTWLSAFFDLVALIALFVMFGYVRGTE